MSIIKKLSKNQAFWLWGQFTENSTKSLNILKNVVQNKLSSPEFEAHITLAGPYKKIDKSLINSLNTFFIERSSINLYLKNYEFQDYFYKSFYISVRESNDLKKLRNEINFTYPFNHFDFYDPHISLAYGSHPIEKKYLLLSGIEKPMKSILMNKVSIVDVREEELQWNILESFNLK